MNDQNATSPERVNARGQNNQKAHIIGGDLARQVFRPGGLAERFRRNRRREVVIDAPALSAAFEHRSGHCKVCLCPLGSSSQTTVDDITVTCHCHCHSDGSQGEI